MREYKCVIELAGLSVIVCSLLEFISDEENLSTVIIDVGVLGVVLDRFLEALKGLRTGDVYTASIKKAPKCKPTTSLPITARTRTLVLLFAILGNPLGACKDADLLISNKVHDDHRPAGM